MVNSFLLYLRLTAESFQFLRLSTEFFAVLRNHHGVDFGSDVLKKLWKRSVKTVERLYLGQ